MKTATDFHCLLFCNYYSPTTAPAPTTTTTTTASAKNSWGHSTLHDGWDFEDEEGVIITKTSQELRMPSSVTINC